MREGKARSIVIQFFRDVVLTKMGAVRAAFLRSFRRLNPSTQALTHSTACLDRVSCGIPEHHPAVATKLHVPLFSLHFRFSYGISFRYCDPRCSIDYLNNKNKKRKREKKDYNLRVSNPTPFKYASQCHRCTDCGCISHSGQLKLS